MPEVNDLDWLTPLKAEFEKNAMRATPSLGFVLEQVQEAAHAGVPRVHLDISMLEEASTPYGSECLVMALTKKGLTAQAIRAGDNLLYLSISGWAD